MKKIIFSLTLLLFVLQSFSQDRMLATHDKDFYSGRSKHLRNSAWVLAGTGAVAATAGILIIHNNQTAEDLTTAISNVIGGVVLTAAGIAALSTSIPLFIISGALKRKAARLSFNPQKTSIPVQNSFVSRMQPALTLSIRL